jgi:hypothetical protein
MDRQSVERALFFTPDIRHLLRPQWRGNELQLIPRAPLRDNTTFVITLGADAMDARRNRLGRSVTLAFSTGSTLDDATLSGSVIEDGRPVEGAWVWIYPAGTPDEQVQADPGLATAEPADQILPLYVTQTDDSGHFEAGHLAVGTYRVFAFRDSDNNRYYDPDRDLLAVAPNDIRFEETEERIDRLNMALAARDTTGPALRSAVALDPRIVEVRLSEPVAPGTLPRISVETYAETDPEAEEPAPTPARLRVLNGYVPVASPSTVVYRTERMAPEQRYRVSLTEAMDALGNPAEEATRPITFATPSADDTSRPALESVAPPDSTRTFNHDSFFNDTAWLDPRTAVLISEGEPVPDGWYDLHFPVGSLWSWTGTTGPAEDEFLSWQGSRPPGRGWLRITVKADSAMSASDFHIIIEGVGSATVEHTVVVTDEPGEVLTPLLTEGPYLIWGFADANRNGRLDIGTIRPWEAAERVDAIPDTQYVRDTFEGIVGTPLELGGIRRTIPIPTVVDTGRVYPIPSLPPPSG